jgi:hypothetical protein
MSGSTSHKHPIRTAEQAADAIFALINAKPRSPTTAEIAAIIAKAMPAGPCPLVVKSALAAAHAKWRKAVGEHDALIAAAGLEPGCADHQEAQAQLDAALDRMHGLQQAIWQQRAASWEDVALLADVAFRTWWAGHGLDGAGADGLMADGPFGHGGMGDEAIAALLSAIRDVHAAEWRDRLSRVVIRDLDQPQGPRPAADRVAALRAAITELERLEDQHDPNDDDVEYDQALEAADRRLTALTDQIYRAPPRTVADLLERALLAKHYHRHARNGCYEGERWVIKPGRVWTRPEDCDGLDDAAIAHLIVGVLQYAQRARE